MIKRMIRMTNNLKLKHKLIISYILVVMIPVLIVGGVVTAYFRQQAMDRAIEQSTNNVQKVKSQMANMMRVPTDISNSLLVDKAMEDIVNTQFESVLELTKAYLAYDDFRVYVRSYREISAIRFYFDNSTLINNLELIPINDEIRTTPWYKQTIDTKNIGWFYIDDDEDIPVRKLSLVRKVSFPDHRTSGILMIVMEQDELNRILKQEQFETLIADTQGYIVAAQNTSLVGKKLDDLDFGVDLDKQEKGTHELEIKGKPSYMVVDELFPNFGDKGLKIISLFTTESIVHDANSVSIYGMLIIFLVLVIALIFVNIVSFLTTNRLLRLSRHFNRLGLGDLNVISRIDGNDEIGQLSRQFNNMVQSINRLMSQVVEKTEQNNTLELAQREIKLKMMASQINPHFLFNALESIRMNAHLKGEKEISNVVRLLGKLMRKNLEVGREKAPLKEEIEMIRSYLEIQKFRYEDRLDFELIVDPAANGIMIPPLIIQPLVENAVVHGLENKEEGVKVEVRIEVINAWVQVIVRDNGMGMTPERLEEVLTSISGQEEIEGNRIGLRNVHQRLVLSFTDECGLRISSQYSEGTEIVFRVPANSTSIL